MLSLPVPRFVFALAGLTVWMVMAIPGMVAALSAAAWWYGLELEIGWLLIPAVLLTVLMATSVGFALAHAIPDPSLTVLVSQVLSFFILMYSPINFPPERLPGWLQTAHAYLPLQHAAVLVRGALGGGSLQESRGSLAVLLVWTLASWAVSLWILNRRA